MIYYYNIVYRYILFTVLRPAKEYFTYIYVYINNDNNNDDGDDDDDNTNTTTTTNNNNSLEFSTGLAMEDLFFVYLHYNCSAAH
jgi:hypothetical protein